MNWCWFCCFPSPSRLEASVSWSKLAGAAEDGAAAHNCSITVVFEVNEVFFSGFVVSLYFFPGLLSRWLSRHCLLAGLRLSGFQRSHASLWSLCPTSSVVAIVAGKDDSVMELWEELSEEMNTLFLVRYLACMYLLKPKLRLSISEKLQPRAVGEAVLLSYSL